jgi:ribonuclease HI
LNILTAKKFKINNPKKYELLAIGKKIDKNKETDDSDNESLILDDVKIKMNYTLTGVRFLGVWLNNYASFKSHNTQIENIVKKMINIMKWKKLTAKECIFLWNSVVIPMIEYQLQCTVLKDSLVDNLDSKIRNLIKSKSHLAVNTNNSIVHDKDFLGCKSIKALQLEALIKGIIYSINNDNILGRIMKIKIVASIKEVLWFNGCVFNDIKNIRNNRSEIWLIEALKLLAEDNIKFCAHDRLHHYVTKGGHITIDEMIDKKIFPKNVNSIKSVNVMYVTQLIDINNHMLTWKELTNIAGRSSKGKIPGWFILLEHKLIKDRASRKVFTQFEIIKEVFEEYSNNKKVIKNKWKDLEDCFNNNNDNDLDRLLEIDNRFNVIEKVFVNGGGHKILEEAFIKSLDWDNDSILNIYTDASKKGNDGSIGWVILNEKDKILGKYYLRITNNFEAMELEILAILAALFSVRAGKHINLYTDNLGVCQLWNKLFNEDTLTWSTRRIWNMLYRFINDNYLEVAIFKVKSHSNNVGNDMADLLCKMGLVETNVKFITEIRIDTSLSWKYMVYWRGLMFKRVPVNL